jgi:hypothetical protein
MTDEIPPNYVGNVSNDSNQIIDYDQQQKISSDLDSFIEENLCNCKSRSIMSLNRSLLEEYSPLQFRLL